MIEKRIDFVRKIVVVLVLGLVLSLSSLSIKTVNAHAGQVTLKPSDDTFVDFTNPGMTFGDLTYLTVVNYQSASVTVIEIVWLKFNLSSVPEGAVVDVATLQLYASYVQVTANVDAYYSPDNSWNEQGLAYSGMPGYNATSMDSVLVTVNNQWYNWSVLDAVKSAEVNDNLTAVTIVLAEPNLHSFGDAVEFDSKESPVYPDLNIDYRPELTIHWSSVVPEFPTFLVLPFFTVATLIAVAFYKKT